MNRRHFLLQTVPSAAVVTALAVQPAAALGVPIPRFYEGSAEVDEGTESIWLATYQKELFGWIGTEEDLLNGDGGWRVYGKVRRGKVKGSLFDSNNQVVGILNTVIDPTTLSVTYQFTGEDPITADCEKVGRDDTAATEIAANYSVADIAPPASGSVSLNRFSRTFNLAGRARTRFSVVNIIQIDGKWIVGTDGYIWLLPTQFSYNPIAGLPDLPIPLPRKGVVAKMGYVETDRGIDLTNPFDDTEVFLSLKK